MLERNLDKINGMARERAREIALMLGPVYDNPLTKAALPFSGKLREEIWETTRIPNDTGDDLYIVKRTTKATNEIITYSCVVVDTNIIVNKIVAARGLPQRLTMDDVRFLRDIQPAIEQQVISFPVTRDEINVNFTTPIF